MIDTTDRRRALAEELNQLNETLHGLKARATRLQGEFAALKGKPVIQQQAQNGTGNGDSAFEAAKQKLDELRKKRVQA